MPEKLKVAIIGYGKVGHIRSTCIANNPELELVCVCDSHLSKSKTNGDILFFWKLASSEVTLRSTEFSPRPKPTARIHYGLHCVYDKDGYPLPNPQESIDYYNPDRSWELEMEGFVRCIQHDQPVQQGNTKDAWDVSY